MFLNSTLYNLYNKIHDILINIEAIYYYEITLIFFPQNIT